MKSLKKRIARTIAYTLTCSMLLSASASAVDLADYECEPSMELEEIIDDSTIDTTADELTTLSDQDIILDSVDSIDVSLSVEEDDEEELILDSFTEDIEEETSLSSTASQSIPLNPVIQNYSPAADSIPDPEELLTGYITKQMYDMNNGIMTLSNESAGQNFDSVNYKLYSSLKKKVEDVAAGEISDTRFEIDINDYLDNIEDTYLYPWDLGLDEFPDPVTDDIKLAYQDAIYEIMGLHMDDVIHSLNIDCAYESYWWDSIKGVDYWFYPIYIGTDSDGNQYLCLEPEGTEDADASKLYMDFYVSLEYCDNLDERFSLNPEIPKEITTALNKAKDIAGKASGYKKDYEKMSFFKDEILALSDYNHEAADAELPDDRSHENGPWQIIWVFDDDPKTMVVCEGYAKAFQYLCDLSDLNSITVGGTLSIAGEVLGDHAWNIVTLDDGFNYIVDITNCYTWEGYDSYKAEFFLQGGDGKPEKGYNVTPTNLVDPYYYAYDATTLSIFTKKQLTLSEKQYCWAEDLVTHTMVSDPAVKPTCTKPGYTEGTHCSFCGKIGTPQKKLAATGHSYGDWKVTKSATALAAGSKERKCKNCSTIEKKSIKKLTPTIKLSSTKKTIKKKKSYTLKISNLAKGDAIKSVVSSKKTIATVKKLKKNQYKITAKSKKGTSVITVKLKSGKKATCKITVK